MKLILPRSLDKELNPVGEEVARARSLSAEERLRLVALVCQASLQVLNLNPKRDRVLVLRDRVPASTTEALRRLGDRT